MNSCACASRAARSTSSSVESRRAEGDVLADGRREEERVLRDRRRSRAAARRASRRGRRRRRRARARRSRRRSAARATRASSCPSRCGRSARSSGRPATSRSTPSSTGRPATYPNATPSKRISPPPGGSSTASGRLGDVLRLVDDLEDPLAGGGRALRLADPHAERAQRHDEHAEVEVERDEAADRQLAVVDHARRRRAARPPARAAAGTRSAARRARAAGSPRRVWREHAPRSARANFAASCGSCANALTTWTPTMFSSATVATSAIFCCTSRSIGCETWL